MPQTLVGVLALKLDQDAALIEDMLAMTASDTPDWSPEWPATHDALPFNLTRLAAHLVEAFAGLCACFHRLHPQSLAHFNTLKDQLIHCQDFNLLESRSHFASCRSHTAEGFSHTSDEQLGQLIPTYFTPQGEAFLSVLLENWKHLNHHAYQLFLYLKLMGHPVSTRHLYHFKAMPE